MYSYRERVVYEIFDITTGEVVGQYTHEALAAQNVASWNAIIKEGNGQQEAQPDHPAVTEQGGVPADGGTETGGG